ncbi:discoidin domain-containing protein [Streptomyces klenkii]|uniref:discoidin domain-containing protein n=1 Tax=Streptomyces klenkii TaxID=1420899 RepID=UPI0033ACFF51
MPLTTPRPHDTAQQLTPPPPKLLHHPSPPPQSPPSHDEEDWLTALRDDGSPPLICPARGCRRDNPHTRTYCRHCGHLLRPPPEPEAKAWWRKALDHLRTRYGERPQTWHRDHRWYVLLATGSMGLGIVAAGGGPWIAAPAVHGAGLAIDRFTAKAAVVPAATSASSERDGFPADCATDGADNRAWAPKPSGKDAREEWWQADFEHPFRLTSLAIINGVSKQPKEYLAAGRAHILKAVAITADNRAHIKILRLADQPGPQTFTWGLEKVTTVQLQLTHIRADGKTSATAPVGLAEVQFFTRKG